MLLFEYKRRWKRIFTILALLFVENTFGGELVFQMKCVSNVKTWIREYNFFEREFKNLIYEKMNNQFISDEKYSLDINFETLISERIY